MAARVAPDRPFGVRWLLPGAAGTLGAVADALGVPAIRQVGDPCLRTPAAPVTDFGPDLLRLVDRMTEAMHAAGGIGLAANQLGVDAAVLVYDVSGQSGVLVNPTDPQLGGPVLRVEEGCLSVAHLGFVVPRHDKALVRGFGPREEPLVVSARGLLARCLQHEVDHLRGRLYIDMLRGADRREANRLLDARSRSR